MIPINLKAAFRQLWKTKLFSTVNKIGLSVGSAIVMALLTGMYLYAASDSMHLETNRRYLKTAIAEGREFMQTAYPLPEELLKTCPEAEAGTHAQSRNYPWLKYDEKETQETGSYVATRFFSVFCLPQKYGNAATTQQDMSSIVISDKIAIDLLSKKKPVGKVVTADDRLQPAVIGVLKKIPCKSPVPAEIFLTTALPKDSAGTAVFILLIILVNLLKLNTAVGITPASR